MVSGYEGLIAWSESSGRGGEATDDLKAERTKLGRFRQEMLSRAATKRWLEPCSTTVIYTCQSNDRRLMSEVYGCICYR